MTLLFYILLMEAAYQDVCTAKISNELIYQGMFYGMVIRYVESGAKAYLCHMAVSMAVFVIFLIIYLTKGISGRTSIGGGDVKILTLCGMFIRPEVILTFIWLALLIGLVIGLIKLQGGIKKGAVNYDCTGRVRMGVPILLAALVMWKQI